MKKRYLIGFIIVWLIMSCNNQAKKKNPVEHTGNDPVHKMDLLEKMFTNDNWMKVDGQDTSYYYFSRIQSVTRVYHYRLVKGDSVNTDISLINLLNDSLVWKLNDTTYLFLAGINENGSVWDRINQSITVKSFLVFEKKDERNIYMKFADSAQLLLIKTLPLSAFLVRSRYDFLHGTRFAFTDTVFSTGKKK